MAKEFLQKHFINEAKAAINHWSGAGGSGGSGESSSGSTIEVDILPKTKIAGFTEEGAPPGCTVFEMVPSFTLEVGSTYLVEWDNETYKCTAIDASAFVSGMIILGNGSVADNLTGNNEPFAVMFVENVVLFVSYNSNLTEHDVKICKVSEVEGSVVLQHQTISENGTYDPEDGYHGFTGVTVDIPAEEPVLQCKNIYENGYYYADEGYDGFSDVVVKVGVTPGLYKSGTNLSKLLYSWNEMIDMGGIGVSSGTVNYCTQQFLNQALRDVKPPDDIPEINEYGFCFDVIYTNPNDNNGLEFHEDGSVSFYSGGDLLGSESAGSLKYAIGHIDCSSIGMDPMIVVDEFRIDTVFGTFVIGEIIPGYGDLILPNDGSVTSLNSRAFRYCSGLVNVYFGDNSPITSIGESAFQYCTDLANVDFGRNSQITTISSYAFNGCSSLPTINIPASVKKIGENTFDGCAQLTDIYIDAYSDINFVDEIISDSESLPIIHIGNNSKMTSVGRRAFEYTTISAIHFGQGNHLTKIDEYAFSGSLLKEITFGSNSVLNSIGEAAFWKCTDLTHIDIPPSVTTIGESAFEGCTALAHVTFGDNSKLTTIDNEAFRGTSISSLTFGPDSQLNYIGTLAFADCLQLTTVTILTESMVEISDERSFSGCTALTEIRVRPSLVDTYKADYYWSTYADKIVGI